MFVGACVECSKDSKDWGAMVKENDKQSWTEVVMGIEDLPDLIPKKFN